MPNKRANVKNEKQYEALKDKGMSKERAARIANSPGASSRGGKASHGAHRIHRKPGAIGGCATPGRVFKGTRMPGRMGNERVTTQNLTVHAVDAEKGLLLIKGAVPGPNGGLVLVRTAAKGA